MKTKRLFRILEFCVLVAVVVTAVLSLLMKPEPIRGAEAQIRGWEEGRLPDHTSNVYPVQRLRDGRVAFSMEGYVPFGEDASFPVMQPGERPFFGVPKRHQYLGCRAATGGQISNGRLFYYRTYSPIYYRFWLELVDGTGRRIEDTPETYRIDITFVNMHPLAFFPTEARFGTLTGPDRVGLLLSTVATRFRLFKYLLVLGALLVVADFALARRSASATSGNQGSSATTPEAP